MPRWQAVSVARSDHLGSHRDGRGVPYLGVADKSNSHRQLPLLPAAHRSRELLRLVHQVNFRQDPVDAALQLACGNTLDASEELQVLGASELLVPSAGRVSEQASGRGTAGGVRRGAPNGSPRRKLPAEDPAGSSRVAKLEKPRLRRWIRALWKPSLETATAWQRALTALTLTTLTTLTTPTTPAQGRTVGHVGGRCPFACGSRRSTPGRECPCRRSPRPRPWAQ